MVHHITYAFQAIVCTGLFYSFYKLLLEGKTGYGFCRFYLISGVVLAAVIPLLKLPVFAGEVIEIPAIAVSYVTYESAAVDPETAAATVSARPDYLLIAYGAIMLFFVCGIAAQVLAIGRYTRHARRTDESGVKVYESGSIRTPFTFFGKVFLPSGLDSRERQQILTHEASHARHNHGAEIMFMEILKAFMWFNPFVWLSRRALEQVHEYEADNDVILQGHDVHDYKTLLFRQLTGYSPDISSGLACSKTKKRFMMMEKNEPGRRSILRAAAAIPLLGGMLMLFSFTAKEPVYILSGSAHAEMIAGEPQAYYFIDGQEVSKEELDNLDPLKILSVDVTADGETLERYGKPADNVRLITVTTREDNGMRRFADPNVLYFVDHKKATPEEIQKLDIKSIAGISVLKDADAVKLYGEEAKGGVVLLETQGYQESNPAGEKTIRPDTIHKVYYGEVTYVKQEGEDEVQITAQYENGDKIDPDLKKKLFGNVTAVIPEEGFKVIGTSASGIGFPTGLFGYNDIKIIINGKEVAFEEMAGLDPASFEKISIVKDSEAIATHGKNGVIIISTTGEDSDNGTIELNSTKIEITDGSVISLNGEVISIQDLENLSPSSQKIMGFVSDRISNTDGKIHLLGEGELDLKDKPKDVVVVTSITSGSSATFGSVSDLPGKIRYILDGKKISREKFIKIPIGKIENITVLRDKEAMAVYDVESDSDGVVVIKTKK